MKAFSFVLVLLLNITGHAEQLELDLGVKACMKLSAAQKILESSMHTDSVEFELEEHFYNIVADETDAYEDENGEPQYGLWLKDIVQKATSSLAWDAKNGEFSTGVVLDYECAPSAQCWVSFILDCDGTVFAVEEGEE